MSASLVGSEMCIRDRFGWRSWRSSGEGHEPPSPLGRGSEVADSRRPVSYTHLTLPTICSV
eukprot:1914311-Alexandrium_andersonii.AAC.1